MPTIRSSLYGTLALGLALSLLGDAGCAKQERYGKTHVQDLLKQFETPGLIVGEFSLARDGVADGDTLRVAGLRTSLRLLGIDTEETFKSEGDRRLYEAGWEDYLKTKRGDSARPVKAATPLGEDAKDYAKAFFKGVETVRLERDHPKDIRGRFGRYLVYVFAKKDGAWVNYNVECVRDGMSPYFSKYGFSRRFHEQFVAAQEEARAKKIGVWDPSLQHYPDYPERLEWWDARADFIRGFELDAAGQENYVTLTHWDALLKLEAHVDREVVMLGSVGRVILNDKGPTRVLLSRRQRQDFPLIFFDNDVFGTSRIARFKGEFVRITGTVTRYRNKRRKTSELQIVVNLPGQVNGSERMRNYSGWGDPEEETRGALGGLRDAPGVLPDTPDDLPDTPANEEKKNATE